MMVSSILSLGSAKYQPSTFFFVLQFPFFRLPFVFLFKVPISSPSNIPSHLTILSSNLTTFYYVSLILPSKPISYVTFIFPYLPAIHL